MRKLISAVAAALVFSGQVQAAEPRTGDLAAALASLDENLVNKAAGGANVRLDGVCLDDSQAMALVVISSPPAYWRMLRQRGFPGSACSDAAEMVVREIVAHPRNPLAGARAERLALRLKEIQPDYQWKQDDWHALQRNAQGRLQSALRKAGVRVEADPQTPSPPGLMRQVTGRYVIEGSNGAGELTLSEDGTFRLLVQGLYVGMSTWGEWRVVGKEVQLRSAAPEAGLIKLQTPASQKTVQAGGESGPLQVDLLVDGNEMERMQVLVIGDDDAYATGMTFSQAWKGKPDWPIRQIAVTGEDMDSSFLVEVPEDAARQRHFVLAIDSKQLPEYLNVRATPVYSGIRIPLFNSTEVFEKR